MPQAKIGVIGGSGLYHMKGLTDIEEVDINTPFGKPSDAITTGKLEEVGVALMTRAFVNDARMLDKKHDGVLNPLDLSSENYAGAEKKIHIEMRCFVASAKIERV